MSTETAVISGDIHFNLQNLELASSALKQLLAKARELDVPAILNGDTLDQKAIVRGEVANRLIEILEPHDPTKIYINTGNHDLINQKGTESSLNFLRPYAQVIALPTYVEALKSWIVPYFSDNQSLQEFLDTLPKGSRLICHQGILGADLGHYVKDSSSLPPDSFADFRTILSHFHKRQDIECGRLRKGGVGAASYIGSPYSISFTEANAGTKGINILYDDGSLELIPTNLRKHIVIERTAQDALSPVSNVSPVDLVWVKLTGSPSELAKIKKADMAKVLGLDNFKFDKNPTATERLDEEHQAFATTAAQLLDSLIDKSAESDGQKQELKEMWRGLLL